MKNIIPFSFLFCLIFLIQCHSVTITDTDTKPSGEMHRVRHVSVAYSILDGNREGTTPKECGNNSVHKIQFEKEPREKIALIVSLASFGWLAEMIGWQPPAVAYNLFESYQCSDTTLTQRIKKSSTPAKQTLQVYTDTMTLKSGKVFSGVKVSITTTSVVITKGNGETQTFPKSEVKSVKKGN